MLSSIKAVLIFCSRFKKKFTRAPHITLYRHTPKRQFPNNQRQKLTSIEYSTRTSVKCNFQHLHSKPQHLVSFRFNQFYYSIVLMTKRFFSLFYIASSPHKRIEQTFRHGRSWPDPRKGSWSLGTVFIWFDQVEHATNEN